MSSWLMPVNANTETKLQTTPDKVLVCAEAREHLDWLRMAAFPVGPHLCAAAPSRFWARWRSGHSYSHPLSGCSNGWFVCTNPTDPGCWTGGPCSHWSPSPQTPGTWWAQRKWKLTKAHGERDKQGGWEGWRAHLLASKGWRASEQVVWLSLWRLLMILGLPSKQVWRDRSTQTKQHHK